MSHIQLPNFSTLSSITSFNDSEDDLDNAFENNSGDNSSSKFSQYPRPKIVPVDYNKKKQVCVCEQCNGKNYFYTKIITFDNNTNFLNIHVFQSFQDHGVEKNIIIIIRYISMTIDARTKCIYLCT